MVTVAPNICMAGLALEFSRIMGPVPLIVRALLIEICPSVSGNSPLTLKVIVSPLWAKAAASRNEHSVSQFSVSRSSLVLTTKVCAAWVEVGVGVNVGPVGVGVAVKVDS